MEEYAAFLEFYTGKLVKDSVVNKYELPSLSKEEVQLLNTLNGSVFENGLFRFLTEQQISDARQRILAYFHEVKPEEFVPIMVDWFGRYFAIGKSGKAGFVLMFDPAVGEFYQLEVSIFEFLNEDLVQYRGETIAYNRFLEWRERNNYLLKPNECVGFETLLFLGGEDDIDNFSVYDIDVYWELNRQAKEQIG